MIEKTILDYLNANLVPTVVMERPNTPPEKFYILERTGGSINNQTIANGTFVIQSYAPSLYEAASMNEDAMNVVRNMVALNDVNYVEIEGFYNFTDTATKDYRYQMVLRVGYYF